MSPWAACVLVCLGLVPSEATAIAAGPQSTMERFIAEGDRALDQGDYREAIAKYRAAYYGLSSEERLSYLGSIPVRNAMDAYSALVEQQSDPELVKLQLSFLSEFLDGVEREGTADAVGADVIEELVLLRTELENELVQPATDPGLDPNPDPGPGAEVFLPTPPRTNSSDQELGKDWVGLGLITGGAVVAGAGVGVTAGWWTVRSQAEEYADDRAGYEDGTDARTRYLADEEARARKFLIAGSVIVGLGTATALAGGIKLIVGRRRAQGSSNLTLAPTLAPHYASLSLTGRF